MIRKKAAEQDVLSLGRKPVTACAAPSRRVCDHRVTTGPPEPGTTKPGAARKAVPTWDFAECAPWDLNPEPAD